jgi:hypothetical protein
MWRVEEQEAARDARLLAIQRRNERLAAAHIPVDFAERVVMSPIRSGCRLTQLMPVVLPHRCNAQS